MVNFASEEFTGSVADGTDRAEGLRKVNTEKFEEAKYLTQSWELDDYFNCLNRRSNRLKRLIEIKSPECILSREKQMLWEVVDLLLDFLDKKQN
jgi:hypothetical protein